MTLLLATRSPLEWLGFFFLTTIALFCLYKAARMF